MKQIGIVTLITVAASAAAPVSNVPAATASFATGKSVEQFGSCFVDAQHRAGRPWSFVPKSDGGTFSNARGRNALGLYFLAVADRGPTRDIRLESASSVDPTVKRAIDQCV